MSTLPRSILAFSGQHHVMSNASIVNNCIVAFYLSLHYFQLRMDYIYFNPHLQKKDVYNNGHQQSMLMSGGFYLLLLPNSLYILNSKRNAYFAYLV